MCNNLSIRHYQLAEQKSIILKIKFRIQNKKYRVKLMMMTDRCTID